MLFAVGLGLSGMTQPAKVVGFLDLTGRWDPSLACVMLGAIAVHAPAYRLIRRRSAPIFAAAFAIPTRRDFDLRLVGGAALFGIGWGLGGFCPGPAITSLPSGHTAVLLFVPAMVAGMYLHTLVEGLQVRRSGIVHPETVSRSPTLPPSPALQYRHDA
ncbi:MAG: YeeE/YedE family protein [Candidatus Binatia bacterium]|nr:YeeE/YedE family protein [Candidatus Binatia bacterium]